MHAKFVATRLWPVLIFLALASSLLAQSPTPFDASAIDYSKFSPEEIAATERHRDELKKQAAEHLAIQAEVNTAHGFTLEETKKAADDTKKSFEAYQLATEAQITKGNKAIAALDHVLKKLHLAKWIINALVLAVAGLIALKVPPPLGLYVAGAVFVAGSAVTWIWV